MTKLDENLHKWQAQVQSAINFLARYPKLADVSNSFSISESGVSLAYWPSDADGVSEIFGKDGWTAEPNYSRTKYDWRKDVDGVRLTIYDMQEIPQPIERPVSPKDWPIQLPERATEPPSDGPLF